MALEAINDKCWSLLDWLWDRNIPIGAAFEKYNLPPLLFPLIIILAVLVVVWLFATSGGMAADACGDGICSSPEETCANCPADCGVCKENETGGFLMTVEIIGSVSEPVTVTLLDENGKTVQSETDRKSIFEFTDTEPQTLQAKVACPNGKEQTSRPREVSTENNIINLLLPDGCFDYITDSGNSPVQTHGNVIVQTYDSQTGLSLNDATVKGIRVSDDISEGTATTEEGSATLNLPSGKLYYLTVSKSGYSSYNGDNEQFYMIAGDTVYKNIPIEPLASAGQGSAAQPGIVEVCASSPSGPIESGRLSLLEPGGTEIDSAMLNPQDNGCITFEIEGGKSVKATMTAMPSNCISPGFSDDISVSPGSQKQIYLDVTCGDDVAYAKVIVHGRNGDVLTNQVTVTLWNSITGEQIPGNAPDSSLSLGTGGYTEEITVPAETLIQAKASGTPLENVDTVSGPAAFMPGEHGSIDIILGEQARDQFNFRGASLVYTPAQPGNPVQVFVQSITYNQTVLTNENSEVKVLINGKEYNATYITNQI
jgi:hypothetical protein